MNKDTKTQLPSVFDFLNYRLFLDKWMRAKKEMTPHFSHRLFAKKAGYTNPSLLGLIIKGERNLSDNLLPGFIKTLQLNKEEESFFRALVILDRTKSLQERTKLLERLMARRRYSSAHRIEDRAKDDGFLYLTRWYLPAIREMVAREDFQCDAKWVAERLRPKISISEVEEALNLLKEMGMISVEKDGSATQTETSIITAHEVASIAVRRYHQGMGTLAIQELDVIGGPERHFGAVTVLIPPGLLPRLKKEVAQFQEYILDLCDRETVDQTLVMQLNLQLFPLSNIEKSTEEKKK